MRSAGPLGGDLLAQRYRLIDRVGTGGMSVVWRARDEVLDRLVAVKWLGAELSDDGLFRDLIRREAWATARIKHPAVAAVYDYGEVAGRDGEPMAYVVMEMLDGQSLAERLRLGPVPWPEALTLCAEVADALATAHDQGVVHRDVSPDNVMLTSSGLRLFDFGIAAPIGEPDDDATGSTFGTPAYVAPERLDGQPAQTATDVYALGVLLFEMLTGAPPFPEDTWDPEAARKLRTAPRPRVAGLPAVVARLDQRCLAHDPARRPSARTVADQLTRHAQPGRRRRSMIAVAAAVMILLGVVTAFVVGLPARRNPVLAPDLPAPTATTAAPVPTSSAAIGTPTGAAPSSRPAAKSSRPTSKPTTTPPTAPPPVTADEALNGLQEIITTGASQDTIRLDVANDLHNQVSSIAGKLAMDPNASVGSMVTSLRNDVIARSLEQWGPDSGGGDPARPPIAATSKTALLAGIDELRTALGLT